MPKDNGQPDKATPSLDYHPDRPLGWAAAFHRNVVLVPWGENPPGGAKRAAGLFDAQGAFLVEGHCWRYAHTPITVPPVPPLIEGEVERLQGKWLFGGLFYGHFGHFLVETTTRLWALGQLYDVQGIVFYPKQHLTHERRQYRDLLPFFEALGLDQLEIRVPQDPVVIDELATPPPGFGLDKMMAGTPEYRAWMRGHLGQDLPCDGPRKVYISRRGLTAKRGSVLCEDRLEALMLAAGYTIVHPQDDALLEQLNTWKSARQIVSVDGSALHLAAMVAHPDTQVAILNRGPSSNIEDYILQFRAFAGVEPLRIETVRGFYHRADTAVVKRETHAVLDLPATGAALAAAGFIPNTDGWEALPQDTLDAAVTALEAQFDAPLAYHDA